MRLLNHIPARFRPSLVLVGVVVGLFGLYSVTNSTASVADLPQSTPTPADPRFEEFKGECKTFGLAYEGAEDSAEDRVKVFGPANTKENIALVYFFGHEVLVHDKVAPCLEAVEHDLEAQGTTYQVKEIGGYREERADRPYWFHQYGGGVDINPATNPICTADLGGDYEGVPEPSRCKSERPYDLPDEWIKTFERYGFYWGGNFSEGKDYMHFEWHGEKP